MVVGAAASPAPAHSCPASTSRRTVSSSHRRRWPNLPGQVPAPGAGAAGSERRSSVCAGPGLFGGAWWWVSSQYYVGSDNGNVTVFRGIPQNVGSLSLSSVVETTAIPTVQLPVYAQELVTATIAAESRTDADRIVAILDDQATTCRTKPKTEGLSRCDRRNGPMKPAAQN